MESPGTVGSRWEITTVFYRPNGQGDHARSRVQGNASLRPLLGTINVIFATLGRTRSHSSIVMSIARLPTENSNSEPKRARVGI